MNKIKRAVHLIAFVCLIILASIGIGLSGGIPIPLSNSRKETEKENIELLENQDETSDTKHVQQKG